MKLNIEMKMSGHENILEERVLEIIKNSTFRSAETYVGNYLGDKVTSLPGKFAVNTTWGSALEAKDQYLDGKGYSNTKIGEKGMENAATDYARGEARDFIAKTAPQYLRNVRADIMIHNLSKQSIPDLNRGFMEGAIKHSAKFGKESISRFGDFVKRLSKL